MIEVQVVWRPIADVHDLGGGGGSGCARFVDDGCKADRTDEGCAKRKSSRWGARTRIEKGS